MIVNRLSTPRTPARFAATRAAISRFCGDSTIPASSR